MRRDRTARVQHDQQQWRTHVEYDTRRATGALREFRWILIWSLGPLTSLTSHSHEFSLRGASLSRLASPGDPESRTAPDGVAQRGASSELCLDGAFSRRAGARARGLVVCGAQICSL